MPIQPEDHALYLDFASKIANKLGYQNDFPEVVWHYTTGEGLIGILTSGSIFSTQLACLNDQTEIRYGTDLVRAALRDVRHMVEQDETTKYLFDLFDKTATIDVVPESPFFVACFSKHADDLSQWRAYGGGENGYAIGLTTKYLMWAHSIVAKVNYDPVIHQEVAFEVATAVVEFFKKGMQDGRATTPESWAIEFLPAWDGAMGQIGPMIKNPAFEAEGEFRCIHRMTGDESGSMQFRQKQTLLSRHLPLVFPPIGRPRSLILPITEIIVGPCRHPRVTKASVEILLDQKGYRGMATVSVSRIPFQIT